MGQTVTIYLDVPRRAAADTPTPPARVKTRGGGVRLPSRPPPDPDGTIVVDSPDGAGTSGRICDPEDPSALAGLLPSEVASRCVALGERVAALREETRALAAEANDARRRAREAEDAAAAELATDDAEPGCARTPTPGRNTSCTWRYTSADAPPSPNERARPRLCARRRSSASGRTSCSASAERSRRSRRSVNSSATSPRAGVVGEEDLIRRFRGEVAADPRRAVETLCRSLAGKNRQLHQQVEEYNKLATRLREKERALAAAEVARGRRCDRGLRITRGRGRGNRPRPAISPVARVRSADAPRAGGVATTTTRGTPRTRLCFLARGRRRPNARDATRISPTSRTSPSRRREETPSRWRGSRRGGAREGRSVAPRPRVETDPDSGSGPGRFVRDRRRTSSSGPRRKSSGRHPRGNRREDEREDERERHVRLRLSRERRVRVRLSTVYSSCAGRGGTTARRGVEASRDRAAIARFESRARREGRAGVGVPPQTVERAARSRNVRFDRAGRASSRGAPLCDARDDARRAERTRVD